MQIPVIYTTASVYTARYQLHAKCCIAFTEAFVTPAGKLRYT